MNVRETTEGNGMGKGRLGWAPLTGLAFVLIVIIAFITSGEPPDVNDESAQKLVDFYKDNEGQQVFSAILEGLAATLLVFFGGVLRRALRDSEGEGGWLSSVAFAGTIIIATGLAIDATITIALTSGAGEVDPAAIQTLALLYENDFVPMAVGMQVFLLATGISIVTRGALPKWLGWVMIVFAVLAVTPIGFVAFIAGGLLVGVIGVLLYMRGKAEPAERPRREVGEQHPH